MPDTAIYHHPRAQHNRVYVVQYGHCVPSEASPGAAQLRYALIEKSIVKNNRKQSDLAPAYAECSFNDEYAVGRLAQMPCPLKC